VNLINSKGIFNFLKKHKAAGPRLNAWRSLVQGKQWLSFTDIQNDWPNLRFVGNKNDSYRIVFKVSNDWRIDTRVNFKTRTVVLLRIGSHEEYNKWTYD